MKKYLIKGLLTLFVGGFVASCADDDVNYIPIEQQKATAYAEAFKDLIGGEVAPDHDWGFTQSPLYDEDEIAAIRAMTRATIDVNGNMWDSKPEVTAAEAKAVWRYVNMTLAQMRQNQHEYSQTAPRDLSTYYCTQVWGQASYSEYIEKGATDPNCIYSNYDHSTNNIVGPEHMDQLSIAMSGTVSINGGTLVGDWEHIYNFNATGNTNYGGNTGVIDGGTLDFVYRSSEDHKFHNKWIIIDGNNIVDETGVRHTGKYYVCFDFYSCTDECYTNCSFRDSNNTPYTGKIEGAWNSLQEAADAKAVVTYTYWDGQQNVEAKTTVFAEGTSDWQKSNVNQGNMCIPANDIYTDWIIRLVSATNTSGGGQSSSSVSNRTDRMERHKLIAQGRIFCEDLGTNAQRMTKSDIDFNDAVFDARIWRLSQYDLSYVNGEPVTTTNVNYIQGVYTNGIDANGDNIDANGNNIGIYKYVAEILLLAAGGTVPLRIGGICDGNFEIHDKFGTGNNRNITHTTIINTVGEPSRQYFTTTVATDVCNAVKAEIDITSLVKAKIKAELDKGKELKDIAIGLDIIPIEVQWVSQEGEAVGEISANYGQAPQKLRVDLGTRWVYERVPIIIKEGDQTSGPYRDFDSYARNKTPEFWKTYNIDWDLLYPNIPEGMTASVSYDEVKIAGTTTTTTTTETILWEGEKEYGSNGSEYTYSLYNTTFSTGNKIRVYGSGGSGNISINNATTAMPIVSKNNVNFTDNEYVDIKIENDTQATELSNGATVSILGSNFTITKLSKIVKTTN